MRIGIVANDTRGGVQPYVALGVGLKRAGHAVTLAAPSDFTAMIVDHGLTAAPLSGSVEAVVRASGAAAQGGPLRSMRLVVQELGARLAQWTTELISACQDADAMTGGVGGMVAGLSVAEKLGKPFIETHLQPVGLVSSSFPGVLSPRAPRWPGVWPLSHHLSHLALWTPFEMAMAKVRKEQLNLPARAPSRRNPILYGFSRHILPPLPQHDRARYVTGYWTLPEPDFTPPAELERFLATSDPVVSIGFGSMAGANSDATGEVLKAIRSVGVKAVLLTGWGGLADASGAEDVFVAPSLPHDWLFPRMAAVIHHGGAGTTGASLGAGAPTLVVPFGVDQPFWGARVAALGVGPEPISRSRLTADRLARALDSALTDSAMRERAGELGRKIRTEDGVRAAVEWFSDMRGG